MRRRHFLLERWNALALYLRTHRVCVTCAKTFANAAVYAEQGRRVWYPPTDCSGAADSRGCRRIAESVWPGRPDAHLAQVAPRQALPSKASEASRAAVEGRP